MKTPREIYAAYTIMPSLQLHQLRVAAVAKLICGNFQKPVNTDDVILACLFHDMGNIVKFDLALYPDLLQPEGREYWQEVKNKCIKIHGSSAHGASIAIAREINLSDSVISIIDSISFSEMEHTMRGSSQEVKVAEYADCRIAPHGTVSIKERFADAVGRYAHRYRTAEEATSAYAMYTNLGLEIERQLFANTSIKPEDISDAALAPLIEELWEYAVA